MSSFHSLRAASRLFEFDFRTDVRGISLEDLLFNGDRNKFSKKSVAKQSFGRVEKYSRFFVTESSLPRSTQMQNNFKKPEMIYVEKLSPNAFNKCILRKKIRLFMNFRFALMGFHSNFLFRYHLLQESLFKPDPGKAVREKNHKISGFWGQISRLSEIITENFGATISCFQLKT